MQSAILTCIAHLVNHRQK